MVFGHTSRLRVVKITAIYFTCMEKISWGRSKTTKLNTSNLCKHLMTHKDEYKNFVKNKNTKEKTIKNKGNGVELQQTTLESIVERCKSIIIEVLHGSNQIT